jgi:hypothetical protein
LFPPIQRDGFIMLPKSTAAAGADSTKAAKAAAIVVAILVLVLTAVLSQLAL